MIRIRAWMVLAAIGLTWSPARVDAAGATRPVLKLRAGDYHPGQRETGAPAWYRGRPERLTPSGRRLLVAIASHPLDPDERAQVLQAGADPLAYLPENGYLLSLPAASEPAVRALPFVAWLGELPPHHRIAPDLSARAAGADQPARIRILLHAGEPAGRAMAAMPGLEAASSPSGFAGAVRILATVPAGRLAVVLSRLADLPEVEAVESARTIRPMNQDGVWVHQSFVGPSPQQTPIFDRGIFGCGQVIAVSDSGQDYGECHFLDPVAGPPPISLCASAPCPAATPAPSRRKDIIYYNWSGTPTGDDDLCPGLFGASGHGTHTSGSAAGDRSPYADCSGFTTPARSAGDGQAPGAKLVLQEMGDGLEYLNNLGGSLWNLADVAFSSGARIHSLSWGGGCSDSLGNCIAGCEIPYDSLARDADLAMWSYPDLMLSVSAGNAGQFCPPPISVGTPAVAKSPLTVGSVGHGSSANVVSDFSSPGPVFDGRLKPTVAAQGESVVSAASDADPLTANCSGCSLDGTSMAAPTAAGLAALVREYYTAGYLDTGARNPSAGFVPSGALVKATLIDGAVALGASTPYADFESGHGRLLLSSTLPFSGSPFRLSVDDHRQGLITGGLVTHAFDVAAGTPFRATLVWSDFPAALAAATARVNELKLEVVDPNGETWFQTIDPGTGAPRATRQPSDPHDPINVEERIVFESPSPGRWIVRVRGVDVPWGPQPFALVVRGSLTDCPAPASPSAPSLATPADHQVQVSWDAVASAQSYNVYRAIGSCPATGWIPVALGVGTTSHLDSGVSGGATYSYRITSASDPAGACESAPSGCASVAPTGDCFLAPAFAGATQAVSAGEETCGLTLSWGSASPRCPGDIRYNVYRSQTPGFVPGPSHLIAACLTGTTYADSDSLLPQTAYHYVVRAEDATTGHGGPCRGGNQESNTAEVSGIADGPPALGTWSDDAGDTGQARLQAAAPWSVQTSGGATGPRVYLGSSSDGVCADLTSPPITLDDPASGPLLTFRTRHDLEYDPIGIFGAEGSLGQVEIATGPGFVNWARLPLSPDYPEVVEFPLNNCPSTANPETYFTGFDSTYRLYTASLANWAGGDVRLRFHLSSDLLYPTGSWWIDDVQVTQAITPQACSPASSAPPPVPDGASVPGIPMDVARQGADLQVSWDASTCAAPAANVYWGSLSDFTRFVGAACGLAWTGSAVVSPPDDVWLLVVATDGGATDGSWSRDAAGTELGYSGATAVCPAITAHSTAGTCP